MKSFNIYFFLRMVLFQNEYIKLHNKNLVFSDRRIATQEAVTTFHLVTYLKIVIASYTFYSIIDSADVSLIPDFSSKDLE